MARNRVLDIAKGIAIILMIIGHCGEIPYMPWRHFIYTFHMPLFFLVSGYLYRQKGVKESLIKDLKHLMIPYFITCIAVILFHLLVCIVRSGNFSSVKTYIIASLWGSGTIHKCMICPGLLPIGAIWFLPALFVCKNVYNIIPTEKRFIVSAIVFLVATLLGRYVIYIPFSILCGLSAIIFYAIGDYLKGVTGIKWYYWLVGIICWFVSFKFSLISIAQPRLDLYYIDVIGATTASILVYLISTVIAKNVFISKPLSWIGEHSLYILCFHLIDLDCWISPRFNFTNEGYVTILLRLILPVCGAVLIVWIKNNPLLKVCQKTVRE